VLDVGCGYGVIGLLASRMGAAQVDLVDIDLLAITSARENIVLNDVRNAQAIPSDLLSAVTGKQYNLVASNPPFHVGVRTDYEIAHALIAHAQDVLEPDGRLIIVANKFLRYDRLMSTVFGNVHCLSETNRYHVLVSRRPLE
jgi:16S rRNA (guanine1207-N2)-methyltransferase